MHIVLVQLRIIKRTLPTVTQVIHVIRIRSVTRALTT